VCRLAGYYLIDSRAHAITHGLYVFQERLVARERPFFDADTSGLIGDPRGSQYLGFRLTTRVSRGNHNGDARSMAKLIRHRVIEVPVRWLDNDDAKNAT
jgi:hypothetical protein